MRRPLAAGLVLLAVGLVQCGPRHPPALVLPAQPRVLVFSPHPDDETIALGGLLFDLARAGTPVRVVFLTSGDGYLEAAQARFRVSNPGPAEFLALGKQREGEARAAGDGGQRDRQGDEPPPQILYRWRSPFAMTRRWISFVPSPMIISGASR